MGPPPPLPVHLSMEAGLLQKYRQPEVCLGDQNSQCCYLGYRLHVMCAFQHAAGLPEECRRPEVWPALHLCSAAGCRRCLLLGPLSVCLRCGNSGNSSMISFWWGSSQSLQQAGML